MDVHNAKDTASLYVLTCY